MSQGVALPRLALVLIGCLVIGAATAAAGDTGPWFLAFPFDADTSAEVTANQASDATGLFWVALQRVARLTDYDADQTYVKHAFFSGYLTRDDIHFTKLTPELAYKIVEAISHDADTRHDGAVWGVRTKINGTDALRLTVLERTTRTYVEFTVEIPTKEKYGDAVARTVETLKALAARRQESPGEVTVPETATDGVPPQTPPSGPEHTGSAPPTGGDGGSGGNKAPPTKDGNPPAPGDANPGTGHSDPTPPAPSGDSDRQAWPLITQAHQAFERGATQEAIDKLDAAYALPSLAAATKKEILELRWQAHRKKGDLDAAIADVTEGLKIAGDEDHWAWEAHLQELQAAKAASSGGDEQYASWNIQTLERWLVGHPTDDTARFVLVDRYMNLQPQPNWAAALRHTEQLRVSLPHDARVLIAGATCELRTGHPASAIELLAGWQRAWPTTFTPQAARLLVEAKVTAGKPEEALDDLVLALRAGEKPAHLAEEDLAVLAQVVRAGVIRNGNLLQQALRDAGPLVLGQGTPPARTREEIRAAGAEAGKGFAAIVEALDAVEPSARYRQWYLAVSRVVDLLDQAQVAALVALDGNDKSAYDMAGRAYTLGLDQFGLADKALPAAAPVAGPGSSTGPEGSEGL